jgi:hypothetical protein
MNWYVQNVICFECKGVASFRSFQFRGDGSIKLVGWCGACRTERCLVVDAESLIIWAKHHDNPFPTEEDKKFLHDFARISWETKQLPPPK